jgi:hypothetical protein
MSGSLETRHSINLTPVCSFTQTSLLPAFQPNFYMHLSFTHAHYMSSPLSLSLSSTISFYIYLAKRTSYEAPYYAVSSLLSLQPSSVQTFSSAPSSQTSSICATSLMSETKFRTHTKHKQNCGFLYSSFYVFRQQSNR